VTPYATSSDYTTGPPVRQAPANIDALLWTATFRVANACNRNPYTDTPTGATAAALRDATTAQAAFWATVGTDPDAGGLDVAPVKRSVLLDATIETDTTGQVEALASCDVCDTARAILLAANLLWSRSSRCSRGSPSPRSSGSARRAGHVSTGSRWSRSATAAGSRYRTIKSLESSDVANHPHRLIIIVPRPLSMPIVFEFRRDAAGAEVLLAASQPLVPVDTATSRLRPRRARRPRRRRRLLRHQRGRRLQLRRAARGRLAEPPERRAGALPRPTRCAPRGRDARRDGREGPL
jgi:hypothetical protein